MNINFKDKNVLVTGAAGGIGSEIVKNMHSLGASIIISGSNEKKLANFSNQFSSPLLYYPADLSKYDDIEQLVNNTLDKFNNKLDILINCGWSGKKNTFESINSEDWQYDIDTCLTGVFDSIKIFLPNLKKGRGNILNIGSAYSHVAPDYRMYSTSKYANPPSYGSAKAGVVQLTKYCASFFSKYKIRVNCLSPGAYPFPKTIKENPKFIKRLSEKCPANRIGYPDDLKGAVALLCSDAGSFITGQNILVDGGWSVW